MADQKKPSLRALLAQSMKDATIDPQTGLVGRRFERTMGCWNCIHGDFEEAGKFWTQKRVQDLEIAMRKALESPMGEQDPAVVNVRAMTAAIDEGIRTGNLTRCRGQVGRDAKNNPVGDLVKSNYLCDKWTARTGASVAREGQKADPLPMELEDKTPQGRN